MNEKERQRRERLLRQIVRLMQAPVNDAVKLAYLSGEDREAIDGLELGCLTEFRRNSNGTVEVKLTDRAAVLVKLVAPLYRRARVSAAEKQVVLDTVERIGAYFLELFVGEQWEVLYQLCLDAKGRKLHVYKLGEGDVGSVGLNVRRIMENALHTNAMMVVLAHNHPSGVALPSPEDVNTTQVIRAALEPLGVGLLDHLIFVDGDLVSVRETAAAGDKLLLVIDHTCGDELPFTREFHFENGELHISEPQERNVTP